MNFDFSPDQKSLRDQARKFLSEHASSTRVRRVLDTDTPYDALLWKGMAEMGWQGTAIPEAHGGAGFGHLELCVLAEELGRSLAPTPFASTIYLAAEALLLAGSDAQKKQWLPRIAQGDAIGCLALAEGPAAPAADALTTRLAGGAVTGTKAPVLDGDVADFAVVAARDERGSVSLCLVDLTGPGVTRAPLKTVDPTRSVAQIAFAGAPAQALGPAGGGWELVERLLDRAAVLIAFEQVGGAQAALDMAREYAIGRFAFGRPIASFQAIKHKLADMYVAVELARSNAYYGAWALSTEAPELPVAAASARVSATEAYFHAAKENIQTHGGMGFTWEFDCHLYYRRAKLLALALGSARRWKDLLIARLEARADREAAASTAGAPAAAGAQEATMDFSDTREEAAFRADARSFLARNAEPRSGVFETWQSKYPDYEGLNRAKEFQRKKAEAGFAALHWPKEWGGRGLSPIYQVIYAQE